MSRIFTSLNLNPSCSMLCLISGGELSRLEFIKISPWRGHNQIGGQIPATDIVESIGNPKGAIGVVHSGLSCADAQHQTPKVATAARSVLPASHFCPLSKCAAAGAILWRTRLPLIVFSPSER